jgi:formylglycine-generating enzyme required for sulfatase activity
MAENLGQPVVFISAVTAELGPVRDRLTKVFEERGAKVIVQKDYPSGLADGPSIQRKIEETDVAICLIGHRYGWELPSGNRPPEAEPGCSWTQWEYFYARKHAKEVRLFMFEGPKVAGTKEAKEEEELSDLQEKFREFVKDREEKNFGGKFYLPFDDPETLIEKVIKFVENFDGEVADFQRGTWNAIKKAYRTGRVESCKRNFPFVYKEKGVLVDQHIDDPGGERNPKPPFIASQGFSILVPGPKGEQAAFLTPARFLSGRDTEVELHERSRSEWRPVSRKNIVTELRHMGEPGRELAGVPLPQPRRLFLISGGGVGKTTNMRWLEAELSERGGAGAEDRPEGTEVLAVLVGADMLVGRNDEQVLEALTKKIAHDTVKESGNETDNASKWHRRAIRKGLVDEASAGALIILIDGLDHVEAGKIPFLISIQSHLPDHYWARCGVVAAGRPHAVQGWKDTPAQEEKFVATIGWRFLEPAEFEPHEAEVFLGTTSEGHSRYELVEDKLAKLIQVPRVLEYVRELGADRLESVRTSADIYEGATRELIKRTLTEGGSLARMFGPEDLQGEGRRSEQIDYVMKVLAALAFIALCPTTDPSRRSRKEPLLIISDDVKNELWSRVMPRDGTPGSESDDLARDLRALAKFAGVLGNGLLDATDTDTDTLRSVIWSNRTIHQFLAAYWLAKHARGIDAVAARLAGKPVEEEADSLARDADRFRCYLFHPEADVPAAAEESEAAKAFEWYEKTDVTYEFNQFLAEMPVTAMSAESWVAAASAWYDPEVYAEFADAAPPRIWAAEMIYRSWSMMLDIAGQPFDDWWDLPYEKLIRLSAGKQRGESSVHERRRRPPQSGKAARVARTVLARFFGDFESILKGKRRAGAAAIAQDMIADRNWIDVDGGSFEMGMLPEKQGFPRKVKAFWLQELDALQTGSVTAEVAAKRDTKKEWFTGAQGKLLLDHDIEWLTDTYRPLEPHPGSPPLERPNRDAPEYQDALTALENRWSRHDETPAEPPPHQVGAFTMHRYPILHRWFWLFAPGHRGAVELYLGEIPHPEDDHPAIYISWYDAWAFCQWGTWTVEDASARKGRRRYGLRLPHEPEWEYAARWSNGPDGKPIPVLRGRPFWWDRDLYKNEDSPEEEQFSEPEAHAIGSPGQTRSPLVATPNGLGFHDILGNVWEWTASIYDTRKEEKTTDIDTMHYSRTNPTARPPANCPRTMRGGLWYYLDVLASCTARFRLACDDRDYKMSFRVIREELPLA